MAQDPKVATDVITGEQPENRFSEAAQKAAALLEITSQKLMQRNVLRREYQPTSRADAFMAHPLKKEGGSYNERLKDAIDIGSTLEGAVRVTAPRDTVLTIYQNKLVTKEENSEQLSKRSLFLKENLPEIPAAPECGIPITNSVLALDTTNPLTLNIVGEGATLETPLHVVTRGPLTVIMAGKPDKYTGCAPTFGSLDPEAKIEVRIGRTKIKDAWEVDGFELVPDQEGKVAGFRLAEGGPVIQLKPGQEMAIIIPKMQRLIDPIAYSNKYNVYPEWQFKVKGGSNKGDADEQIRQQKEDQEKTKPGESIYIGDTLLRPLSTPAMLSRQQAFAGTRAPRLAG